MQLFLKQKLKYGPCQTELTLSDKLQLFANKHGVDGTNKTTILDIAVLRSGRLGRKVELPLLNEEARAIIMQFHSRKMIVSKDGASFVELARSTVDLNGDQLKAVCVEVNM